MALLTVEQSEPHDRQSAVEPTTLVADTTGMTQLIETRWKRYGKDRVYLKTAVGDEVGHVDLVARCIVAKEPGYELELDECLRRWTSGDEPRPEVQQPEIRLPEVKLPRPLTVEPALSLEETRDLAANVAGAAARAKREEVNAQAPVMNFVARVLGVKTDERAWRVGAKGEEKVARELTKLGPTWRVLHAVEVGNRGSDIDHVLIGPAGVLTLNAKRHPRGKAWVGDHMVLVGGQRTDYLRNSRFEAQRAARLLSAAGGRNVPVVPVIVFVDLDDFKVKQMPTDVHVTTCRRLVARSASPVAAASRSSTLGSMPSS